ncbi:O-antigen ligase family protein [Streptomyces lancefieldiae]|uniref:O-antigen ligase family protein n=1 Tax=Streptomyces lancefieldiae TaxID=3075520 RepID=A0ABU3ARI7_9ACTN|nr:O-antigen ligase family protein [Streptomyces sp. DSM 40712]MDT0612821.1 O-antigen ligase family protein [Streptomyces sp. DSM 40712]
MSHTLAPLPRRAAALVPVLPLVAVLALLALPPTGDGAGPADVASGLVVAYCVIRLLRERRRPLSTTAVLVLGLPVVGIALAAAGASSPQAQLVGTGRYLQLFVLVPATVLVLVRHRADFRLLAWSFVGLAVWQGAVGVHQYVTGSGASYQGEDIRAVGTFGAHDVMGMASAVSLGVVCAVGIALGRAPVWQRVTAAGCALALLAPLAVSFSRGAWIATALTCAVQLALAGLRRALKVAAALTAAGVILMGGFGVGTAQLQERIDSIARVTDAPDQSVVDRYSLWSSAAGMWREHPLTGVGLKNFPAYRDGHATLALSSGSDVEGAGVEYQRQALLSPHSMYLLLLSEQGLIGLLTLAGSWLALLVCAVRRLPRARRRGPGLDCALVACGLLVWLLTDFVYGDIGGPSTLLTGMGLGLAAWWALADGEPRDVAPRGGAGERVEEAVAR